MKKFVWIFCVSLASCNGTLTEEQKRKIREEREESQIKKIAEADITEAAFANGRTIATLIEKRDKQLNNTTLIDSLEKAFEVEIIAMQTNDSTLRAIEQKVIEAYITGGSSASLSDNVQKMGKDSILYTKPLMLEKKDGSVEFTKALGIRMSKRNVIRSIK
jgi:nitrous oxide reductase